jgi:hypothetical protein
MEEPRSLRLSRRALLIAGGCGVGALALPTRKSLPGSVSSLQSVYPAELEQATPLNEVEAPAPAGSSPERFSFASTRLRWPTVGATGGVNIYFCSEFLFATPDYQVEDARFFIPSFFSPSSGVPEQGVPDFTVQGLAIDISGALTGAGNWTPCDGSSDAGLVEIRANVMSMDGVLRPTSPGELLPPVKTVLQPGSLYRARLAWFRAAGGGNFPRVSAQVGSGCALPQERVEGASTSRFGRLNGTLPGALSGTGGVFLIPAFMIAKGGDGRKTALIIGDSIGYGVTSSSIPQVWTSRAEFGFLSSGLDSDSMNTRRLPHANFCIPGQRAVDPRTTQYPWNGAPSAPTDNNWGMKRAALQRVRDAHGSWPFDMIICQHVTNSIPHPNGYAALRSQFQEFYSKLKAWYGCPIYQMQPLPHARSVDGYQTAGSAEGGGQTPANGWSSADQSWRFTSDLGGAPESESSRLQGLSGPTLVSQGFVEGSFSPWVYGSADMTGQRDIISITARPFATRLASSYPGNGPITLFSAPEVGEIIQIQRPDGKFFACAVQKVTGSGPFTVAVAYMGSSDASVRGLSPADAGAICRASLHDGSGLHPSPIAHQSIYVQSPIDWKKTLGY